MESTNKTRVVGWHPRSARLVEWLAAEVERRGGGRGVQSDILDEALADYAASHDGPVTPARPRKQRAVPARKISVELTREQAEALRLAADYILYAGDNPTAFGWSPGTVKALENAYKILDGKVEDVFTVEGEMGGDRYTVEVAGPDPLYGTVGASTVTGYLAGREGGGYAATPTGPYGVLDMNDPATVLGALLAWTSVHQVTGDAPDLLGAQRRDQPGTVY